MRSTGLLLFVLLAAACHERPTLPRVALRAAPAVPEVPRAPTRREMQGLLALLASDSFEGRAPGTRGARLAAEYVQSLFELWGLEPGAADGYRQPFALRGVTTDTLEVEAAGQTLRLRDDVMGGFTTAVDEPRLALDAVFVGFGITTDLWDWDDFEDVDVRGKLLIARVNDPGLFDDSIFEGRRLTYFGRWTYHIEEATRRGAAGILLIHTDVTAGYGWGVVQASWGGERLSLADEPTGSLQFSGWVREESLRRVLAARGVDLDDLYARSQSRSFRPVDLGLSVAISGRHRRRALEGANFVARIPGRSPRRIVLSAHLDHLGVQEVPGGDGIFNGAVDNASALTALLLTARSLAAAPPPAFSITVLACDAEEAGLLGSRAYLSRAGDDPIVANVNFESTPVWEAAGSLMGIGAEHSTLEDSLRAVARAQGLAYAEFSMTDQGFFFRSDQFSFARRGIPSLWISAGEDDRSGQRRFPQFWRTAYHTVDDEYDPAWPLEALAQTVQAAVGLVDQLGREPAPPRWKGRPPFPMVAGAP